jgi:hypothetical protein
MRSMSVATHHVRSPGHQRLALSGHRRSEKADPAALSGPRSSAIARFGIAINGTVPGGRGSLPYPSHTANQHSVAVAVKPASTAARFAAVLEGSAPIHGGVSQTPACAPCVMNLQSPVSATHSIAGCAIRPFAAATGDHGISIPLRAAGCTTRAYASKASGRSEPTPDWKLRTLVTIQSASLTSSTRLSSPKRATSIGRTYRVCPSTP